MDYFHSLLESYDKLKKRTLKLKPIKEEDDPGRYNLEALAKLAIKKTIQSGATKGNPFLDPKAKGIHGIYISPTGTVNAIIGSFNRKVADVKGDPIEPGWTDFVGAFAEEQLEEPNSPEDSVPQEQEEELPLPFEPSPIQPMDEMSEIFKKIGDLANTLCRRYPDGKKFDNNCAKFKEFLVNGPESIQVQMSQAIGVLIDNGHFTSVVNVDQSTVMGVLKNLEIGLKILSRKSISVSEKYHISNIFSLQTDGSVVIRSIDDSDDGLVFLDQNNFLKELIEHLSFGAELQSVDTMMQAHYYSNIAWNSMNLHDLIEPISIALNPLNQDPGSSTNLVGEFTAKFANTAKLNQSWVPLFGVGVFTIEAKALRDAIIEITGAGFGGYIQTYVNNLKKYILERQPTLIMKSVDLNAPGARNNAYEVWGLESENLPEDLELLSVRKVFKDKLELKHMAQVTGNEVFVHKLNTKTYTSVTDVNLGEMLQSEISHILCNTTFEGELAKNKIADILGIPVAEMSKARRYAISLSEIRDKVSQLPARGTVEDKIKNKRVVVSPLKTFAERMIKNLQKDLSFASQISVFSETGSLIAAVKNCDLEDDDVAEIIKERIIRFMVQSKKYSDIKKELELVKAGEIAGPAMINLALEMMVIGGVVEDFQTDLINDLKTRELLKFNHNDVLVILLKEFLVGRAEITIDNGIISIHKRRHLNQKIKFWGERRKGREDEVLKVQSRFKVSVSKDLIKSVIKKTLPESNTTILANKLVQNQIDLIQELIKNPQTIESLQKTMRQ